MKLLIVPLLNSITNCGSKSEQGCCSPHRHKSRGLEFKDVLSALFYPDDQEEIRLFLEQSQQETLIIVRIKVRRMQRCLCCSPSCQRNCQREGQPPAPILNDVSELVAKVAETEKAHSGYHQPAGSATLPQYCFLIRTKYTCTIALCRTQFTFQRTN